MFYDIAYVYVLFFIETPFSASTVHLIVFWGMSVTVLQACLQNKPPGHHENGGSIMLCKCFSSAETSKLVSIGGKWIQLSAAQFVFLFFFAASKTARFLEYIATNIIYLDHKCSP